MSKGVDVLMLGTHPDDVEISCGGTILQFVDLGRTVVVADLTRGEKATRGTAEIRATECEAATRMLNIKERINLELPDTELRDREPALRAVVEVLRRYRPRLLFAPHPVDVHPDHAAAARIAGRAYFLAGLRNFAPDAGPPHRPRLLLRYPGNDPVEPSFCVDISPLAERKREVIRCYATQVDLAEKSHLIRGLDPLERAEARDRFFGARIGYRAAEPFTLDGPLPLSDPGCLLQ